TRSTSAAETGRRARVSMKRARTRGYAANGATVSFPWGHSPCSPRTRHDASRGAIVRRPASISIHIFQFNFWRGGPRMKPFRSLLCLRSLGLVGVAGASAALAAFAGCSDSSSASPSYPPNDAAVPGPDVTTGGEDGGTPEVDSGETTDDGGATGDAAVGVQQGVTETILFSDTDAGAKTDPNLVNPWGLAFNPSGIAWVANNHTGTATLYSPTAAVPLVVTVPGPDGGAGGTPTGQVFNAVATNFMGDKFLFATEDGTIAGWQTGTAAMIRANASGRDAIYKGLAIAPSNPPVLLAADFHNAHVDVFDANYAPVAGDGGAAWTDPSVPAGFAPFNIATLGDRVYIAYAKQDAQAE